VNWKWPSVDLIVMKRSMDPVKKTNLISIKDAVFSMYDILPYKRASFEGTYLSIPRMHQLVLEKLYGVNFLKNCRSAKKHYLTETEEEVMVVPCDNILNYHNYTFNDGLRIMEFQSFTPLPKILHRILIWNSDQAVSPKDLDGIDSCLQLHPSWELRVWNNDNIEQFFPLKNQALYDATQDLKVKMEILSYEILNRYGGIFIGNDYLCKRSLDTLYERISFFPYNYFLALQNKTSMKMMDGFFAAVKNHFITRELIDKMEEYEKYPQGKYFSSIMDKMQKHFVSWGYEEDLPVDESLPIIDIQEIAKHNTSEDAWIIIYNQVYSVSKYAERHPGRNVILRPAGRDATEDFEKMGHDLFNAAVVAGMKDTLIGRLSDQQKIPKNFIKLQEQNQIFK